MIEVLPSPDHVAAFRMQGRLSSEDYDRCVAEIEARLAKTERIGVYLDMAGLDAMSPEVVGKDLRYALAKFGEYGRFARSAVVTERGWLGRVSELAGKLFPDSEIRAYEPGQQADALAWVAALPQRGARH